MCNFPSENWSMVTGYVKPKEHKNEITNGGLKYYLCMMLDSMLDLLSSSNQQWLMDFKTKKLL